MKKLLLFTLLLPFIVKAQSYNAGSPVYELLASGMANAQYSATGCTSVWISLDQSVLQFPTGTQVYLKITGGSMAANSLHETTTNTVLNAWDSLIILPAANQFMFYSSSGTANFYYAFIRCGTPTNINDSFPCNGNLNQSVAYLVDGCSGVLEYDWYSYGGDTCVVNGPLGENSVVTSNEFDIYPNPASSIVNLQLPKDIADYTMTITDILGNEVMRRELKAVEGSVSADISSLAPGVYMIRVENGYGFYAKKIVTD